MADSSARIGWSEGGQGPTLLLLHGYPLDHRMWARQRETFSRFCRVVSVDLPGFGTARAEEAPDTMAGVAESVRSLVEGERLGPLTVLGHSFGGYVALELYQAHPELFDRLVLLSTRAEADDPEAREKRLATARRLSDPAERPDTEGSVRGLVAEATWLSGSPIVGELRTIVGSAPNSTLVSTLRAIAGRQDHRGLLPLIRVPTLAIWGEGDRLIAPDRTRALAEGISGAVAHGIPGAGHMVPLEAPDPFEVVVREFLGRPR